jgi:hypothetical protein
MKRGGGYLSEPREYKDGMFRALFNDEVKALKLYEALSGKTFGKETKVELKTLENVFLSKVRNDLTFVVDGKLIIIVEHQATRNPNIPLRSLEYIVMFFKLFYGYDKVLYKEKPIRLPKPAFYMLYNGTKPYPAAGVIKLSDLFIGLGEDESPGLELTVNVININYGINMPILEKSDDLKGYAILVEKQRCYMESGESLQAAIKRAVEECISEGILVEFLTKYKDEVNSMFSLMYDEEVAKAVAREEGVEDGIVIGLEQGLEQGIAKGSEFREVQIIERMLLKGRSLEEIADDTDTPLERVIHIKNGLSNAAALV